jgi:hypothetical protein
MSNPTNDLMPMASVCDYVKDHHGFGISRKGVWDWIHRGVRGTKLPHTIGPFNGKLPARILVSASDVDSFVAALPIR